MGEARGSRGCTVLHDVDAEFMHKNDALRGLKFDMIVFNFPHAGFSLGHETQRSTILEHRKLVAAFFNTAARMLVRGGEVHVTHRNDDPYRKWKIKRLAAGAWLELSEMVEFRRSEYPGYMNKRGDGLLDSAGLYGGLVVVVGPSSTPLQHAEKRKEHLVLVQQQGRVSPLCFSKLLVVRRRRRRARTYRRKIDEYHGNKHQGVVDASGSRSHRNPCGLHNLAWPERRRAGACR